MKNVIFDFDGTIVDSLDFIIEMYERWYPKTRHLNQLERNKLREESLIKVAEELRIRPWKLPLLIVRGKREMNKKLGQIKMIQGIDKTIIELKKNDTNLFIASSNSPSNIKKYLKIHHLRDNFTRIYGNVGLLSKAKVISKIISTNNLNAEDTYYIGDEVRDIKAAQKAGVKVIAVSYGFNGKKILSKHNPDFLVDSSQEILKIILT
jgi:phosphoglycolate phosphatase